MELKYHIVVLICVSLMTNVELYIKGKCYGMWIVSQNKQTKKQQPTVLKHARFFHLLFSFLQYGYEMEEAGKNNNKGVFWCLFIYKVYFC